MTTQTQQWHFSTKLNKLVACKARDRTCTYGAHFATPEDAAPFLTGLALQANGAFSVKRKNMDKITRTIYLEAESTEEINVLMSALESAQQIETDAVVNNYYGLLRNMFISKDQRKELIEQMSDTVKAKVLLKLFKDNALEYNNMYVDDILNQDTYGTYFTKEIFSNAKTHNAPTASLLHIAERTPSIGYGLLLKYIPDSQIVIGSDKLQREFTDISRANLISTGGEETSGVRTAILSRLALSENEHDHMFVMRNTIYAPENSYRQDNRKIINTLLNSPNVSPVMRRLAIRRLAETDLPYATTMNKNTSGRLNKEGFTARNNESWSQGSLPYESNKEGHSEINNPVELYNKEVQVMITGLGLKSRVLTPKEYGIIHKISRNALGDSYEPRYSQLKKEAKKNVISAQRVKYASDYIDLLNSL